MLALYSFVFIGLFSPGPNTILLTASGAQFGFRATVPHVLGIAIGVCMVAGASGAGLSALLLARPGLELTLRIAAAAWIFWLAWGLWQKGQETKEDSESRPFTFVEAILFQWVNPKVWAIALAASAAYGNGLGPLLDAARLALVFTTVNLSVCFFWAYAGSRLGALLKTPKAWQAFRTIMSILLAASAGMVFF